MARSRRLEPRTGISAHIVSTWIMVCTMAKKRKDPNVFNLTRSGNPAGRPGKRSGRLHGATNKGRSKSKPNTWWKES